MKESFAARAESGLNPSMKTGVNPGTKMDTGSQSKTVTPITGGREASLANLKPFQPGQSGNPSGRPKKIIDAEKLAEESLEDAMKMLKKLMKSDNEKVALAAAQTLIDRAMGKARQSVAHTIGKDKDVPELTTAELIDLVRSRTGTASTETSN